MRSGSFLSLVLLLLACRLTAQVTPLDWNARWDNYVQRTYGWRGVGMIAAETAFDQTFQIKKCGRPPYCFPSDFGGALARKTARTTIELATGALLHEDLRRSPSNLHGIRQRIVNALIHAPLAKGSDGKWEPAYSRFAGTLTGETVSLAWRGKPITAPRILEGFGWSATSYFQDALWTEFEPDLKRLGRRFIGRFHHSAPDVTLSGTVGSQHAGETTGPGGIAASAPEKAIK